MNSQSLANWICTVLLCLLAPLSTELALTGATVSFEENASELIEAESVEAIAERREKKSTTCHPHTIAAHREELCSCTFHWMRNRMQFPISERTCLNGFGGFLIS